jgi:ethanolamine-phosphate cytidylyltransferase
MGKAVTASPPNLRDEQQIEHRDNERTQVRVFMDGAFDLCHYGHFNAFRLGRSVGTYLVVGLNSDSSIAECKGNAPLMNESDRAVMVQSCKFVDEIITGVPYIMNEEYLQFVIEKYNIDYVLHGDDPCLVNGQDVYASAKAANKYRSFPRTEGISTTDIVGRMLQLARTQSEGRCVTNDFFDDTVDSHGLQFLGQQSLFLTTSHIIRKFSNDAASPANGCKVVYIDGDWDMFHPGHVRLLEMAKKVCRKQLCSTFCICMRIDFSFGCSSYPTTDQRGDYLIVGVHGDNAVVTKNERRRIQESRPRLPLPLMNLNERALSVLACRHVDEVVFDAPYTVTMEMVASLNISEIIAVDCKPSDCSSARAESDKSLQDLDTVGDIGDHERFRLVRDAGIVTFMDYPDPFKLSAIVERIQTEQDAFQSKYERKMKAEREFYQSKHSSTLERTEEF